MLIPFVLVIGLLIATAVIAHVADNLGKKLGKKRISLFGLRPRTSATIATVGSGWAIMIFTLAVLLSTVAPLRNALFYYQSEITQAKAQIQDSRFRIIGLQRQTKTAEENAKIAAQQTKLAEEQNRKEQEKTQEAQQQTKVAQKNLQSAQAGEQNAKISARKFQTTARVAQINARKAQNAAGVARNQELTAKSELANAQGSLKLIQAQLKLNQTRLQAAQSQLNTAGRQVVSAFAQVVVAEQQVSQSNQQVQQAQRAKAKAQKEVNRLQTQIADLQVRANEIAALANSNGDLADYISHGYIRLAVDQTLTERRIDAPRSPADIKRELGFMVGAARDEARQVFENDKLAFNVGAAVTDKSGASVALSGEQVLNVYSKALASANQTVSARLVSAFNFPSDTTYVIARFVFVPITTIYISRENIAEMSIETDKSESAIFGRLEKLVDLARANAVKRGASPPLSRDNPNFFDGDTGPKIFEALREIQKFDHPVKVRIVAARDLDSAEPLQIRFIVGDEA